MKMGPDGPIAPDVPKEEVPKEEDDTPMSGPFRELKASFEALRDKVDEGEKRSAEEATTAEEELARERGETEANLKAENTRLQKELDDKNRQAKEEQQKQAANVELKRKQDELEARTKQEMEDAIARREALDKQLFTPSFDVPEPAPRRTWTAEDYATGLPEYMDVLRQISEIDPNIPDPLAGRDNITPAHLQAALEGRKRSLHELTFLRNNRLDKLEDWIDYGESVGARC